jgi:hypothetical protein
MSPRVVMVGRNVVLPQPAANTGGMRDRNSPEDIERLWQGLPQPKERHGDASAPGAPQISRSVVVFPPEYLPPPQATMFQPYLLAATVGAGTVTILWQFVVPKSSVLVIKALDFYASNTAPTTNLVFQLLVNGAPYPGYGNVTLFAGAAAINSRSFNDLTLRFSEGNVLTMQSVNVDGAAYNAASGAQGWHYPRTISDMYAAQLGGATT